jgi:hypothetical protein
MLGIRVKTLDHFGPATAVPIIVTVLGASSQSIGYPRSCLVIIVWQAQMQSRSPSVLAWGVLDNLLSFACDLVLVAPVHGVRWQDWCSMACERTCGPL